MSEIIDFHTPKKPSTMNKDIPTDLQIKEILTESLSQIHTIKDLLIFIIDKESNSFIFNNDSLSIQDKSYLVQMLQHDIQSELNETVELIFEPESPQPVK